MPNIPGTFRNGDGGLGIPPDLEWDEENPPVIFSCSGVPQHAEGCDHTCEVKPATFEIVQYINEIRAWGRLQVVPDMREVETSARFTVILDLLREHLDINEEELSRLFILSKTKILKSTRETNEAMIKQRRTAMMMGLDKPSIVGPGGERLG